MTWLNLYRKEQPEPIIPRWINRHSPNELQVIPLALLAPSEHNIRLFIERESLEDLRKVYAAIREDTSSAVLPDAPLVRFRGEDQLLELLSGHRRVHAATDVGLTRLPCRVVTLSDEEAYRMIIRANQYEQITTVEIAYKAAEMDRLGFSQEEITETLGGKVGINRYLVVGRMVDPEAFTNAEKKCNPSITVWFEAAQHGKAHFDRCFLHWDAGVWDEQDCERQFRKRGKVLPQENYAKGLRLTLDGNVCRIRGTLSFEFHTLAEMEKFANDFVGDFLVSVQMAKRLGTFGPRKVINYVPDEPSEE